MDQAQKNTDFLGSVFFCCLIVCLAFWKLLSDRLKTLLELINASACINELLLAGKERMALGADVNTDLAALGRTGLEGFAASTLNGYYFVVRMESFLHDYDSTP